MTARLAVLLDGQIVGTVDAGRASRNDAFVYSDRWLDQGDSAMPLSLSMPLNRRRHPASIIRTWLEGLLPDDAELLRHWQRVTGAASTDPFDLLATPMGLDCAGAVQVCPESDVDTALARGGGMQRLSDNEVARQLSEMRQLTHLGSDGAVPGYFSLAGAQAKVALRRHRGAWHQPHGTAATTHILKPAVFMTQHQAVIEHLSMAAASRLGFPTANTKIAVYGGCDTVIVKRYDRRRIGDRLLRLHQEDLCQALGLAPTLRYEQHGGPSLTHIVSLLRQHSTSPDEDVADLTDALAYQWIIGAPDGHAKNFSLMLDASEVRLAPMYDVCSVLPYLDRDEPVGHAFAIGGSHAVTPDEAPTRWTRFAEDIDIRADLLLNRIRDIAAAVRSAFADEAALLPGELAASPRVGMLLDRLDTRTKSCLASVR